MSFYRLLISYNYEKLTVYYIVAIIHKYTFRLLVMKLHLIRHGHTNWDIIDEKGVKGMAASAAPLTQLGRLQIETIANDYRLADAEIILSSSYARALESAAILSRVLNKPLHVEYDLHEWLPQTDSLQEVNEELLLAASKEFVKETSEVVPWEKFSEVKNRVFSVLERYSEYNDIVVVTHAVVISSLLGIKKSVDNAEIVSLDIDIDSPAAISERLQEHLLVSTMW